MKKTVLTLCVLFLLCIASLPAFAQNASDLTYTIMADGSVSEHDYVLIVVNGEQDRLTLTNFGDNILFIHQLTAAGTNIVFDQVAPITLEKATAFIISDEGTVLKRMVLGDSDSIMTLPAALKAIGDEAFSGADAVHIVIPDQCEEIGSQAFGNNDALLIAEIPASVTQIEDDSFSNAPNVTIVSNADSYAIQWAQEHHIPYAVTYVIPPNAGDEEGGF